MAGLKFISRPHRNMIFTKSPQKTQDPAVTVDWKIEKSPTIILGNEDESLPSFLSGELSLQVNEELVEIESFGGTLSVHTTQRKPLKNRCPCCKDHNAELQNWSFLKQTTTLEKGNYQFPFSTIIPDDLPASMETPLLSVSYQFNAEIRFKIRATPKDATRVVKFRRPLTIKRSLSIPHYPVHYTRSFPSGGIQIDSCLDPIFRPSEGKKVSVTLKGLTSSIGDGRDIEAWRLMKGSWKLEEKMKTTAKPCQKHRVICDAGNTDLTRTKTRTLREKSLYDGWTPTNEDGTAEMEFTFDIRGQSNGPMPSYAYDTKSTDGTEVTHSLSLELILIKEHFPKGKPELAIRTGVGRILRLDYRIFLVDDSITGPGFVIENLPSYNDVCPSPPRYSEKEPSLEQQRARPIEVA